MIVVVVMTIAQKVSYYPFFCFWSLTQNMKGQMMGDLKDMEPESSSEGEVEEEIVQKPSKKR